MTFKALNNVFDLGSICFENIRSPGRQGAVMPKLFDFYFVYSLASGV